MPRGAGTGIAGGALPIIGGIVVGLNRMNRILEIDLDNRLAVVEPGVTNIEITRAVADRGYFYAPDPSSQYASSIGGNVGHNAGGPHTIAYGVTTHHVLGLELALPDGTLVRMGADGPDAPGLDLTGLVVGGEGTFGIVTRIWVRLMRRREAVVTLLATFDDIGRAGEAVTEIIGRGVGPVALELMDRNAIEVIERVRARGVSARRGGGAADRSGGAARDAARGRPRSCTRSAAPTARRRCVPPTPRRSARRCGSAARRRSGRSGASRSTTTCTTRSCRDRGCRRCCGACRRSPRASTS